MPTVCSVCSHPYLEEIDRALITGEPNRRIAAQYSLSEQAVRRHKAEHLPASLAASKRAQRIVTADGLLSELNDLQSATLAILSKAEKAGDMRLALHSVSQARANLELLARLLGKLQEAQSVSVLVNPEWINLRSMILQAVDAYPQARVAIERAIDGLTG